MQYLYFNTNHPTLFSLWVLAMNRLPPRWADSTLTHDWLNTGKKGLLVSNMKGRLLARFTLFQCILPLFERGLEQRFDMDLCVCCAWVSDCLTIGRLFWAWLGTSHESPVYNVHLGQNISFFSASNQRRQLMVNRNVLFHYWKDSAKTGNSKFLMFKSLDTNDFVSYFMLYLYFK